MTYGTMLVGCIGLTSAAPGAYYVTTGHLDSRAYVLWAINWLFVANQIHFVHLSIQTAHAADRAVKFARGQVFLGGELLTVLVCLDSGLRVGGSTNYTGAYHL